MEDPRLTPKPVSYSVCEMTEVVLPNDANPLGNMLGGRLLHLIDMAAAISAIRHAGASCVTASFDSVDFLTPIHVGEVCILKSRVTWTGTTSMEVAVDVFAENLMTGERRHATTAFTTFVAVDASGRPVRVPALVPETDEDRRIFQEGFARRAERLARRRSRSRIAHTSRQPG